VRRLPTYNRNLLAAVSWPALKIEILFSLCLCASVGWAQLPPLPCSNGSIYEPDGITPCQAMNAVAPPTLSSQPLYAEFNANVLGNKLMTGVTVVVPWGGSAGVDTGTTAPNYQFATWVTNNLAQYAGTNIILNFIFEPVLEGNVNSYTPAYVFTQSYANSIAPAWQANYPYLPTTYIKDSNGNYQQVTSTCTPGTGFDGRCTSGSGTHPAWNPTTGGTTTDNQVTWTNDGPTNAPLQNQASCQSYTGAPPFSAGKSYSLNEIITPTTGSYNGHSYNTEAACTSTTAISSWCTTTNCTVTSGTCTFENVGTFSAIPLGQGIPVSYNFPFMYAYQQVAAAFYAYISNPANLPTGVHLGYIRYGMTQGGEASPLCNSAGTLASGWGTPAYTIDTYLGYVFAQTDYFTGPSLGNSPLQQMFDMHAAGSTPDYDYPDQEAARAFADCGWISTNGASVQDVWNITNTGTPSQVCTTTPKGCTNGDIYNMGKTYGGALNHCGKKTGVGWQPLTNSTPTTISAGVTGPLSLQGSYPGILPIATQIGVTNFENYTFAPGNLPGDIFGSLDLNYCNLTGAVDCVNGLWPYQIPYAAAEGTFENALTTYGSCPASGGSGQCAPSGLTFTISAGATLGPPNYLGSCRSTAVIPPPTLAPFSGLVGAGTVVFNPEPANFAATGCFGSPMIRVTDANTATNACRAQGTTCTQKANQSVFVDASDGQDSQWSIDDSQFSIVDSGNVFYIYDFNPNTPTIAPTLHYSNLDSNVLGFFSFPAASHATAKVFYSFGNSTYTARGTILSGFNTSAPWPTLPTVTATYNFSGTANGVPSTYACPTDAVAINSVGTPDAIFGDGFALLSGGVCPQNTAIYVSVYKIGSGLTTWNTNTGTVSGDWGGTGPVVCQNCPAGTSLGFFTLHNVKMDPSGTWALITLGTCNTPGSCYQSADPYYWLVGTTSVYTSCIAGLGNCSGHWVAGVTGLITQYNTPYYIQKPYPTTNGTKFPGGGTGSCAQGALPQMDSHPSYWNNQGADLQPFITPTSAGTNNPSYNTCQQDEVVGIYPPTAGAQSGETIRFAHNYGAPVEFAGEYGITNVSQTGRFALVTSPMATPGGGYIGQLGSTAGIFPCPAIPSCRSDVFLVPLY
jgi:hypothetical protein